MKISIITNAIYRALGWVTDDLATRNLVATLKQGDLDVDVHEVEGLGDLEDVLRRARPDTLFWGNAYHLPGGGSAPPTWLADVFDREQVPYVGSEARALRTLIDKAACQARLEAAGVPIPRHVVIDRQTVDRAASICEAGGLELPVLVKPTSAAGSAGVYEDSVQRSYAGVERLCRRILERFEGQAIVESFLPGRELTVGAIGNGSSRLVLSTYVDIRSKTPGVTYLTERHRHRDFERGVTSLSRVAEPELQSRLEGIAQQVCDGLGIRDVTRMDCRFDASGEVRVFDVNGMPGLAPSRGCSVQQVFASFPDVGRRELFQRLVHSIVWSAACRYGLEAPVKVSDLNLFTLPPSDALPAPVFPPPPQDLLPVVGGRTGPAERPGLTTWNGGSAASAAPGRAEHDDVVVVEPCPV